MPEKVKDSEDWEGLGEFYQRRIQGQNGSIQGEITNWLPLCRFQPKFIFCLIHFVLAPMVF